MSLDAHLDVSALVEMGFQKERVEEAVRATKNQGIQAAVEWLFNHPVADANSGQKLGSGETSTGQTLGSSVTTSGGNIAEATMEGGVSAPTPDVQGGVSAPTPDVQGGTSAATPDVQGGASAPTPDVEMNGGEQKNDSAQEESSTENGTPAQALSLRCEDCGKQIRSEMDAQAHAARTGHQNFAESSEEIKPLTQEEKEEQKQRLQQRLIEKRQQREAEEKQQALQQEKSRRKTGQEITKARQDYEYEEMKRIAEARRKEKLEEKRLRQKIKDDIAKDRAAQKQQKQASTEKTPSPAPTPASSSQTPVAKKEYTECRLQIRLTNGSALTSSFSPDTTLFTVHEYISDKRTDGDAPFTISTTFPRKIFGDADMLKSLKDLGLMPSAVLVVGRK